MYDRRERLNPIQGLATADVSSAEDSINFIRRDHFFILAGYLWASEWDVEISKHEGQLTHLLLLSHVD